MKDVFQNLLVTVVVSTSISLGAHMYYEMERWEQPATNSQLEHLVELAKANPALSQRVSMALHDDKITSVEYFSIAASIESGVKTKQLVDELKLLAK
jgi:hypothetical protein